MFSLIFSNENKDNPNTEDNDVKLRSSEVQNRKAAKLTLAKEEARN